MPNDADPPATAAPEAPAAAEPTASLPPEHPEAPPAPALVQIQAPTVCRIVEVALKDCSDEAAPRIRRPAVIVSAAPGSELVDALVFLDQATDGRVTGVPVPATLAVQGAKHDDRDDAPALTWRFPRPSTAKLDVEV